MEVFRLPGNHRDRLDAGRPGADDAHAQARKVNASGRPHAGVIPLALERIEPLEFGNVGQRQVACGHDAVARDDHIAAISPDGPAVGVGVELRGHDARVALDACAQLEPVGHVVDVLKDLGLAGKAFGPVPLLLEFLGERVGILCAFDVAARARIAIPEPGAANIAAGLEHLHLVAQAPQAIERIQPGKTGADHDDVESTGLTAGVGFFVYSHSCSEHAIWFRPSGHHRQEGRRPLYKKRRRRLKRGRRAPPRWARLRAPWATAWSAVPPGLR